MASVEETLQIVDSTAVLMLETAALADNMGAKIDSNAVLQGLMVGLHAAENPNLNIRELFMELRDNQGIERASKADLRGLFIGALMVPYVLKHQGEKNV
jgi:hypothetical protein